MEATAAVAQDRNAQILDALHEKLKVDVVESFSAACHKLARWLKDPRAYYKAARPKIVQLLETASSTAQKHPAIEVVQSHGQPSRWSVGLQSLVQAVHNNIELFVEPELQSRLIQLFGPELSSRPLASAHDLYGSTPAVPYTYAHGQPLYHPGTTTATPTNVYPRPSNQFVLASVGTTTMHHQLMNVSRSTPTQVSPPAPGPVATSSKPTSPVTTTTTQSPVAPTKSHGKSEQRPAKRAKTMEELAQLDIEYYTKTLKQSSVAPGSTSAADAQESQARAPRGNSPSVGSRQVSPSTSRQLSPRKSARMGTRSRGPPKARTLSTAFNEAPATGPTNEPAIATPVIAANDAPAITNGTVAKDSAGNEQSKDWSMTSLDDMIDYTGGFVEEPEPTRTETETAPVGLPAEASLPSRDVQIPSGVTQKQESVDSAPTETAGDENMDNINISDNTETTVSEPADPIFGQGDPSETTVPSLGTPTAGAVLGEQATTGTQVQNTSADVVPGSAEHDQAASKTSGQTAVPEPPSKPLAGVANEESRPAMTTELEAQMDSSPALTDPSSDDGSREPSWAIVKWLRSPVTPHESQHDGAPNERATVTVSDIRVDAAVAVQADGEGTIQPPPPAPSTKLPPAAALPGTSATEDRVPKLGDEPRLADTTVGEDSEAPEPGHFSSAGLETKIHTAVDECVGVVAASDEPREVTEDTKHGSQTLTQADEPAAQTEPDPVALERRQHAQSVKGLQDVATEDVEMADGIGAGLTQMSPQDETEATRSRSNTVSTAMEPVELVPVTSESPGPLTRDVEMAEEVRSDLIEVQPTVEGSVVGDVHSTYEAALIEGDSHHEAQDVVMAEVTSVHPAQEEGSPQASDIRPSTTIPSPAVEQTLDILPILPSTPDVAGGYPNLTIYARTASQPVSAQTAIADDAHSSEIKMPNATLYIQHDRPVSITDEKPQERALDSASDVAQRGTDAAIGTASQTMSSLPELRHYTTLYTMKCLSGPRQHEHVLEFALNAEQYALVHQWSNRRSESDGRFENGFCVSLACYRSGDVLSIIGDSTKRPRSEWPSTGTMWTVINENQQRGLYLVPPFYIDEDGFVDVSPYIKEGNNKIQIFYGGYISDYTVVLQTHSPTSAQIQSEKKHRKREQDRAAFLKKLAEPITLPKFNWDTGIFSPI